MQARYGLASTWKHMAEEREVAARRMARIAVALFIVCNVLAATSFSAQSRYSDLCDYVGQEAQHLPQDGELNRTLLNEYCG
ncbi:MAG: hypothetical protein ACOC71_02895 [Hyphomicrobiales bacterium]